MGNFSPYLGLDDLEVIYPILLELSNYFSNILLEISNSFLNISLEKSNVFQALKSQFLPRGLYYRHHLGNLGHLLPRVPQI